MIRYNPLLGAAKKTYVAFVLDKSSSMGDIKDATISAFNEQIDEHRANERNGGEIFLSLVQFSGNVEETFFNVPLKKIEGKLDDTQYVPCGSTSLYDAVGYTVSKLQKLDEPGDIAFLVIVLSDGQENTSKKWNGNQIANLRKELESTGRWTFQYIGSDPNGIREAASTGFSTASFENTSLGVDKLSKKMIGATASYYTARGAGLTSVSNFMEQDTNSALSEDDLKKLRGE